MKVVTYCRVSTLDQNCELQLAETHRYAEARGWAIEKDYIDTGWSGRNTKRPALEQLRGDAKTRRNVDCILVYKIDRIGRSLKDLSELFSEFDSAGVRLIFITQGIDTDKSNPTSRLMMHLLAAFAEFEADLIRERVRDGQMSYRTTFGTGRQRPSRSGRNLAAHRPVRVWDRDEARRLRSEGLSLRTIAARLGVSTMSLQRELKRDGFALSAPSTATQDASERVG